MILNESDLHDYQHKMVDWVVNHPKSALYVDMGLGKTVATLTAISQLFAMYDIARVLVIAPLRVALSTWPSEIHRWSHTRHLTYRQLAGLDSKKRAALCLQDRSQIHFINRELVDWLVRFYKSKWPYDMVIIDESSSFKSAQSNRFKALVMIQHAIGIDRVVELTGTPTSNGLLDLWSQVYLMDSGRRLGHSFGAYRKRYFDHDAYNRKWTLRERSEAIIHDKLKDICLRLSADDYLQMPEKIVNTIAVDMPAKLRSDYDELEEEFLLELETGTVEAPFAAALTGKLLQFCNGALYLDDAVRWEAVHDKKLEALDDVIEEAAGEPVLVAYQFRSDKERILKRYPDARALDKDPHTIDQWNRGEIPILLAHPASAGHGLNLQHGGHILVWFGLPWSLELYQQFTARLHRQGQEKPVFIHKIIMNNTIENVVQQSLNGKFKTQHDLLEALRAVVRAAA